MRPNLFIVGAAKAGTTSIYNYLKAHPDVFFSPIKEPNYFSDDIDITAFRPEYSASVSLDMDRYFSKGALEEVHNTFVRKPEHYDRLFEQAGHESVIAEASTSYLFSETAAANIKAACPEAKIVIVLRNPIERAFSHYLMDLRIGAAKGSFAEALEKDRQSLRKGWGVTNLYLELGEYSAQVQRYFDHFPAAQIKVMLLDDLKTDSEAFLSDLCRFLALDPGKIVKNDKRYNRAEIPRFALLNQRWLKKTVKAIIPKGAKELAKAMLYTSKNMPTLQEEQRRELADIYREDVRRLSQMLGRDLTHWTGV